MEPSRITPRWPKPHRDADLRLSGSGESRRPGQRATPRVFTALSPPPREGDASRLGTCHQATWNLAPRATNDHGEGQINRRDRSSGREQLWIEILPDIEAKGELMVRASGRSERPAQARRNSEGRGMRRDLCKGGRARCRCRGRNDKRPAENARLAVVGVIPRCGRMVSSDVYRPTWLSGDQASAEAASRPHTDSLPRTDLRHAEQSHRK